MSDYVKPQPPPTVGEATPSWAGVIRIWETQRGWHGEGVARVYVALVADAKARDDFGASKYGVRHQHDNGRDHATDAYQEALDGCMYWWAEWKKTGNREAAVLFGDAETLAFKARAYLLKRDGT